MPVMRKPSMLTHELNAIFLFDYELTLLNYNTDITKKNVNS